ncbi:btb poz protein [Pyrenophora teres f. maculata]|nr:btb poz protein [Pyrenophora teres f. maculata]
MEYNKKRNSWNLEDNGTATHEAVIQSPTGPVLKDTVIYCQADKYGLQDLKKLALKKQGLQSGVQCSTVLTSARYAYANTPDTDSKLRAHYLALIIRARHTFKRSGTMQVEMENGGKLFFDLFVAMVNHMDDLGVQSPH